MLISSFDHRTNNFGSSTDATGATLVVMNGSRFYTNAILGFEFASLL